ncbi:MAG: hypothetical protein QM790_20195 [Nibricoccus sp.]
MGAFLDYLDTNKDWLFSGLGVSVLAGVLLWLRSSNKSGDEKPTPVTTVNQSVVVNNSNGSPPQGTTSSGANLNPTPKPPIEELKLSKAILFIDDDTDFPIVRTLRRSGWKNVEIVDDIKNLHHDRVKMAHLFFVDIQGVGKALNFKKEGIGLAHALKETYPDKKVVLYSSVPTHDLFADELQLIDKRMRKTAEFYEFQKTITDLLS